MFDSITATVIASNTREGVERVGARLPEGWELSGRAGWRSAKHLLVQVEVLVPTSATKRERNAGWVKLTSYGITPSDDLGAGWQSVAGVGC